MGTTKHNSLIYLLKENQPDFTMALNLIAKGPAMFLRFSQPRLATFVKYAKVELTPPSPTQLGAIVKGSAGLVGDALTMKWLTCTMGQAAVNTVVVAEIACWFFIGECIGKGSLVGYQV